MRSLVLSDAAAMTRGTCLRKLLQIFSDVVKRVGAQRTSAVLWTYEMDQFWYVCRQLTPSWISTHLINLLLLVR